MGVGAQGAQDLAGGIQGLELQGGRAVDRDLFRHHPQVFLHGTTEVVDVVDDEERAGHDHRHEARGHGEQDQLRPPGEAAEPLHYGLSNPRSAGGSGDGDGAGLGSAVGGGAGSGEAKGAGDGTGGSSADGGSGKGVSGAGVALVLSDGTGGPMNAGEVGAGASCGSGVDGASSSRSSRSTSRARSSGVDG